MSRSASRLFIALILLMLGSATCAYSGAGPIEPIVRFSDQAWPSYLRVVADLLTLPVPTADVSDIRDVVLIVAAGAILVFAALVFMADGRLLSNREPVRVVFRIAVALLILSVASAFFNHRFELAAGWMIRLLGGLTWALALASFLTSEMARKLIRGILLLAGMTLLLTIVHRANRGLAYFSWPIGPITITGALSGVWACISIIWFLVHLRDGRSIRDSVLSALVAVISTYCLWETGRRSAALGLLGGMAIVAAVVILARLKIVIVKSAVFVGLLALAGLAAAYVANQARSPEKEKSGSVCMRLAYWRESASIIAKNPIFGVGPDCFIISMTDRIAPRRAVSPHFYHGSVDPYAHNEWLQAIVELGIPAGLLYLAIPIIAVLFARKAVSDAGRRDIVLAAIGGLSTILINELASINLRESTMPIWYWTMLGLCMVSPDQKGPPIAPTTRQALLRPGLALVGLALIVAGGMDLLAAVAEGRRSAGRDDRPPMRLIARKSLEALGSAAFRAQISARLGNSKDIERARSLWSELYGLSPAFPNAAAMYADSLMIAGKKEQSEAILRIALSDRLDPFNPAANIQYASMIADPLERLRCVQRAIRTEGLIGPMQQILMQVKDSSAVVAALAAELPEARKLAQEKSSEQFAGAMIELLRVNAFIKSQAGQYQEAIHDQQLAANCYGMLEKSANIYRRTSQAEVDAFFALARLIYEYDRVNFHRAYEAICEAERLAVLGIGHEWVADRDPKRGFVIGEVMPTEFPERLRPVWRLSALLHIVQGDDRDLDFRVYFSLPPTQWNELSLHRELGQLARVAYDDLSKIPEAQRPAHYSRLPDMIRRYEATPNDGLKQGGLSR